MITIKALGGCLIAGFLGYLLGGMLLDMCTPRHSLVDQHRAMEFGVKP